MATDIRIDCNHLLRVSGDIKTSITNSFGNTVYEIRVDLSNTNGATLPPDYFDNRYYTKALTYTKTEVNSLLASQSTNPITWSQVTNTPNTLAGYGIIDTYTQQQIDINFIHNQSNNAQPNSKAWLSDNLYLGAVTIDTNFQVQIHGKTKVDNVITGVNAIGASDLTTLSQVQSLIAAGSISVGNGLTNNAGTIKLGGELTEATTISSGTTGYPLLLGDVTNYKAAITIQPDATLVSLISVSPTYNSQINLNNNIFIQFRRLSDNHVKTITINSNPGLIINDDIDNLGFVNGGDFEANFVDRSLITKQFGVSNYVRLNAGAIQQNIQGIIAPQGISMFGGVSPDTGGITTSGVFIGSALADRFRAITTFTGSFKRWIYGTNANAESTGNAGSNFQIGRYNDAGTIIDYPLTINRASGETTLTSKLNVFADIFSSVGGNIGTISGPIYTSGNSNNVNLNEGVSTGIAVVSSTDFKIQTGTPLDPVTQDTITFTGPNAVRLTDSAHIMFNAGSADDTAGILTNSDLNTLYPRATIATQAVSATRVYQKNTSTTWFYFTKTDCS